MKKYLIFLLSITCFFFFLHYIYADDFHLTQDYRDSKVFVTTLFSIDELPSDTNEHYTVEYNLDDVIGFAGENISWDEHVTTVGGRYRRISGVNDFVWVPPLSKIGIFAFIKNEAGHEVTLKDWQFYISRHNKTMGNLGIFGVKGIFTNTAYKFLGANVTKQGDAVYSPLIVNIDDEETKLVKLMSFEIHQPLNIEHFEWTPTILENGDLVVNFVLELKNISVYSINNVEFFHGDFYLKRHFSPGNAYTYEYQINYGNEYFSGLNLLDSFEIKKSDIKSTCIVLGTNTDGYFGDTKTLAFERTDGDFVGKSVDLDWLLEKEAMCITLMPYRLLGKKLKYFHPVDVELSFFESEEVLGVNDDLILNMKIKNNGNDLDSLDVKVDFDPNFQIIKESSCNIYEVGDEIFWNVVNLKSAQELSCNIVFQIVKKDAFLNLKNTLVLNEKIADFVSFKFVPDVEIIFEYDFLTGQYLFESNVEDISSVSFFETPSCKKILFFDLEDEICI